jgi:zinc transport system substrate-binding protein
MKYRVMGNYGRLFALIIAKLGAFVTCLSMGVAIATPSVPPKQAVQVPESSLRTVATIRPIYSLLVALTKGVSQPVLLIKHQASPHHYNLRPSEKRLLKDADLIFWIGPELETFLPNILATVSKDHHSIRLDKSPGLLQLPTRTGKAWEAAIEEDEDCGHGYHHHHHGHGHGDEPSPDPHIWLSPDNAEKMAVHMTAMLIQYDSKHRTMYEKNLEQLVLKLGVLHKEIETQFNEVQQVPFLVFHDGYQYFEQAYGLKGVGAISLNPELPMSSRRLEKMQKKIERLGVKCLFSEPQWSTHLVEVLASKYKIKVGMIDPLGSETPEPEDDYFVNMRALAKTVQACLLK